MKAQEKLQRYRAELQNWLRWTSRGEKRQEPTPEKFGIKASDERFMARGIRERTIIEHENLKAPNGNTYRV